MIEWNEEQLELRKGISQLSSKLNVNVMECDSRAEFSFDKWKLICAMGIPGIPISKEFGGLDKDVLTTMFLLEALGHACEDGGLNFSVSSHIASTAIPIQRFGTQEQKEEYLPRLCKGEIIGAHGITEPGSGSDAFSMRTAAKKRGNRYVLNGSKTFVTNGPLADLIIVYAVTDQDAGALGKISAFIVRKDSPGFSVGKPMDKMGLRTSPLGQIYFDDCEIPEHNILGTEGAGFKIFSYVMKWEILCCFAINLGEMERQLEKCIEYSRNREQFGKPIAKYQSIAHKIVDMKISLETSRALLYKAGCLFQKGASASMDIAIAKIVTSEAYVQSCLDAIQIFGAYGYMKEYQIEKNLRNSVGGKIYSGPSEIQRNIIAGLLGL